MVRGYSQMAAAPLIEFVSAAEYGDMDAVAQLYTDSFAEYYSAGQLVPVAVSAEDLASYLREEQMGLANCPVVLVDGVAAGLATVGVRPDEGTAWCKGFGIVEQFRGAHLGIPLAEEMKRRARAAGATRYMTLGCMGDNWPAIKTYEKSGFSIAHECFSMEWNRPAAAAEQPRKPPGSGLTIADIDAHSLLIGAYDRLHQSSTPVWNRQRPSLEEMSGLRGLAVPSGPGCAVLADDCDSYVLFRPSTDVLSSSDGVVAILDLCGTVAGMTALLTELQRRYKQLAVNSESDHSPALPCLRQAGFTVSHQRLHMVASLGGSETVDDEAKLRDAVIRPRAKL